MTPPGARVSLPKGSAPGGPAWAWWAFIVLCAAGIVVILATHATGAPTAPACSSSIHYAHPNAPCVDR